MIDELTTLFDPDALRAHAGAIAALVGALILGGVAILAARGRRRRNAPTGEAAPRPIGVLSAHGAVERPEGVRRIDATIRRTAQGFELEIRESADAACSRTAVRFDTMAALEAYLESRTPLRIGEFRVG